MPVKLRNILPGVLLLLLLPAAGPALELSYEHREDQVKAAFLFNFARFVDWPPAAFEGKDAPLVFCVLGRDFFAVAEGLLADRTIRGRKVVVRLAAGTVDLSPCHVLFISRTEAGAAGELLRASRERPALLVSDLSHFARRGGMIGLVEADGRIRFEVNPAAVRRAGLTVSSELLRLATVVEAFEG